MIHVEACCTLERTAHRGLRLPCMSHLCRRRRRLPRRGRRRRFHWRRGRQRRGHRSSRGGGRRCGLCWGGLGCGGLGRLTRVGVLRGQALLLPEALRGCLDTGCRRQGLRVGAAGEEPRPLSFSFQSEAESQAVWDCQSDTAARAFISGKLATSLWTSSFASALEGHARRLPSAANSPFSQSRHALESCCGAF